MNPTAAASDGSAAPRCAALGNFDGVHQGHQAVIAAAAARAEACAGRVWAVTFDPHPRRYFRPGEPPFLLTDSVERARLLRAHGAQDVVILPFDAGLAALDPESFVRGVLIERLRLASAAVGADFRFGKDRVGDAQTLRRLGARHGLAVDAVEPVTDDRRARFSSSDARQAIRRGDVREAAGVLGRLWAVQRPVLHGDKRGRTIGFPTANLALGDLIAPARGVYAVRAVTPDGRVRGAVANFGRRPTFDLTTELLEVHIFDFIGDLYGSDLRVEFVDFLRAERRFDGVEALRAQIAADCESARAALSLDA